MSIVPIYGLMAEFDTPQQLVEAARETYQHGYRRMDAYSPFPIEEVSEAIGFHHTAVPLVVLVGGILGGLSGYLMQYWMMAVSYPINVGGRPFHSWPAFIVVTFEMTILFAGIAGVLGMLALNGLPMPYHPVFNVPSFKFATKDKFFLCIEAADPLFDRLTTEQFLSTLHARSISEVPH